MHHLAPSGHQIHYVTNFQDLVSIPFSGESNAACWKRGLKGDFAEIVKKLEGNENITVIEQEELIELPLSEQGQLAREVLLNDWRLLEAHGASPVLNLIKYYDRDDAFPFFPTDVYSFHVDRSPIPTDTFLCTYYGAPSELVSNSQAGQKVLVPEIREELKKLHQGTEEEFESFLRDHFFDLHYRTKSDANVVSLGLGNLCRLAVDYPGSPVLPCIHRAPMEINGQMRLLLIC
ncbi:MAG: hypothetical protein ACYC1Q_09435 [Bacteroidia bacterium]